MLLVGALERCRGSPSRCWWQLPLRCMTRALQQMAQEKAGVGSPSEPVLQPQICLHGFLTLVHSYSFWALFTKYFIYIISSNFSYNSKKQVLFDSFCRWNEVQRGYTTCPRSYSQFRKARIWNYVYLILKHILWTVLPPKGNLTN